MVTRAPEAGTLREVLREEEANASRGPARGKRVLYVVSAFPCWSETFIVREIHALLRQGADVRIVALRRSRETFVQTDAAELMERVFYPAAWYRNIVSAMTALLRRPAATLALPARIVRTLWRTPHAMLKSLVALYRTNGLLPALAEFGPEHVHAHWATYPSTAAMLLARELGCTFSFTAHAHDIYTNDHLLDEKLRAAAFVAAISRFNRAFLRRRFPDAAPRARIEIVHCGVPRQRRSRRAAARREYRILSVGRLDEIKGFPTLLQACAQLRDAGVDFRCEVIGDGPQRAMLQAEIEQLELAAHVQLLGAQPSQEVERRLAAADVFVLASQRARAGDMDGIPVALMEAMAWGTPVVSTAVSGIPELIEDGSSGLLVPPRDPGALAGAIRRMLEDETLRHRCIDGGQRKVQQEFDAESEGQRLYGIIGSLTGEIHAEKIADRH